MEFRNNRNIAFAAMFVLMFICSVSWMYLRMPQYAEKLSGATNASWLLSGYIIAEVSMVVIAGIMLDRLGARNTILIGVSLFTGASFGVTLSDNVDMMVLFRIIQGCGAGFMFTVAIGFIPKIFPKSKRELPHKLMTLSFAVGSIFGTAIGLYFMKELGDWRILMNIMGFVTPICGVIAYLTLPDVSRAYIRDVPGMVLLLALVATIMTYSQMLGNDFQFISWESLGFIQFSIILLILLIVVEKRAQDPALPHFTHTQIGLMAAMFLAGFTGLGMLQYLAMFFIVSYRITIYQASGMMLFLILGGAITSILGTNILKRVGIRVLTIVGPILIFIGFVAGAFFIPIGIVGGAVSLFIIGLGFGCIVTEMAITIQAISPVKDSGMATSMLMSMRFIGIILGMAAYGSIIKTPIREYIENTKGEVVKDVFDWLFNHLVECLEDVLNIFQNTIVQCCAIAGVAVVSVLIIIYYMVGKEDLDAPEFMDE